MTFNYVSHSMMEYIVGKLKDFAAGCAAAVLGTSNDTASDNTVFGAKAAAADVLGTSGDAATANTVFGAKAYSDANKSDVIGESTDAASADTINGAKAYSDANKSDVIGTSSDQASADTINGAKAYADAAIADAIVSAYKPGGSKSASQILDTTNDLLVAGNEGRMYNLTDDLTITAAAKSRFTENAEGTYPAGSNVAVINVGTEENPSYKFDMQPGQYNFQDISAATVDGWFTSGESQQGE